MLPPEIQRIVLLIGMAATAYLLILAWNDDMEAAKTPMVYTDAPVIAQGGMNQEQAAVASEVLEPNDMDIPPAAPLTQNVAVNVVQGASSDRLVTVESAALKVWIDLLGGDIVRVQLPTFPVALDQEETPYLLLDQSQTHTYVAQSALIGADGIDKTGERPLYDSSVRNLVVNDTGSLVLTTSRNGVDVTKTFNFRQDSHLVDVIYEVTNSSGVPKTMRMLSQIKRDRLEPPTDETVPLAPSPYLGAALTTAENNYQKVDFDDVDEGNFQATTVGGWMAFLQHYFISAWIAPDDQATSYHARKTSDGYYLFGFTGQNQTIQPGVTGRWTSEFYAGPKDQVVLEEISPHLNLTVDYGFLWWIAIPLFKALTFFHDIVGNWGLAIILLTVLVKGLLAGFSAKGYRSMANMRRVAPAMKRLQERYANDREKLSKEMMALYQKEGANPLGSCLPMLLPMPVFLALYWVLLESVELRQAPFIFWIEDLAAMDPYFILPLLMGASTYLMQALNPQVGDPMQVRMMKLMPIMFTVLFLFFPAGLVLYWLVNNLLSLAQQTYVYRQVEREQAAKTK
ncbi:MAG: membrane protein insertase YidC [Pseudomonadales bacterium]|jgi:YidC/Oxa1 family membrane protein insertase|nr:membrane protein insertase YidC [Pseudomonadales bacterium]